MTAIPYLVEEDHTGQYVEATAGAAGAAGAAGLFGKDRWADQWSAALCLDDLRRASKVQSRKFAPGIACIAVYMGPRYLPDQAYTADISLCLFKGGVGLTDSSL